MMKHPTPTVTFTIDTGYGDREFRQTFKNSDEALAYLSGYLGDADGMIKDFTVYFDWDTTISEE